MAPPAYHIAGCRVKAYAPQCPPHREQGSSRAEGSPYVFELTDVGRKLFFSAFAPESTGQELWKSDGTRAGTTLVKDVFPGTESSYPAELTAVGDALFFRGYEATNGSELWTSDGTEAGTIRVGDIAPGPASSAPSQLTKVGATLYFRAEEPVHGDKLWELALT